MIIAVTYENGQVFQHFGHSQQFKLYTVEDGAVTASRVVPTDGSGHGALAAFLKGLGAEALICGGVGEGARKALDQAGVKLYGGVTGEADGAVTALLAGTLSFDPQAACSHHGHGDGHGCGGHEHGGGCGGHEHGGHGHGCGCK